MTGRSGHESKEMRCRIVDCNLVIHCDCCCGVAWCDELSVVGPTDEHVTTSE